MQVWPVTASRGRAEWLRRQAERMCPQLSGAERWIVVSDGCAETATLADSLASEGKPLIHVPLASRLGPDRAKRLGLSLVPTDAVVCEVDDHDIIEPGLIEKLREAFKDSNILHAYCDAWATDPKETLRRERRKKPGKVAERGNIGYGMRAYRKWAYDCVGGYPLEHFPANDFELLCRIEQLGGGPDCARHIPELLVTVIECAASVSGENAALQQEMVKAVANVALNGGFKLPFEWIQAKTSQPVFVPPVPKQSRIPRLLHFVWIGGPMPEWAVYNVARFKALNPGWMVLVHDETVLLDSLKAAYAKISGEHEAERKADLLRLSALAKFGGWYFDVDFLPLRPMKDILELHKNVPEGFFLTRATPELVANGIIGATVVSPVLKAMIDMARQRLTGGAQASWDAVGPKLATSIWEQHGGEFQLGDVKNFYPVAWSERARAQAAYRKLRESDCSEEAQREVFGAERPFVLHLHMQGARELCQPT